MQTELAELLKVSFGAVNRWESGKYKPTIKTKRKLAPLFEIIYNLIFGSYKKKKPPKLSCLSRNRRLFFRIFFSTFNGFYCMRLYFLHLANLRTDDPSL